MQETCRSQLDKILVEDPLGLGVVASIDNKLIYFTSMYIEGFKAAFENETGFAIIGNCIITNIVNALRLTYKDQEVKLLDKKRLREIIYYVEETQDSEIYTLCCRKTNNTIVVKDSENNFYEVKFDEQTLLPMGG